MNKLNLLFFCGLTMATTQNRSRFVSLGTHGRRLVSRPHPVGLQINQKIVTKGPASKVTLLQKRCWSMSWSKMDSLTQNKLVLRRGKILQASPLTKGRACAYLRIGRRLGLQLFGLCLCRLGPAAWGPLPTVAFPRSGMFVNIACCGLKYRLIFQ